MIEKDIDSNGRRKTRFLQISEDVVYDERLTDKEYRIISRLLLKPVNWEANRTQICRENNIHPDTATNYIKNMIECGYLRPIPAGRRGSHGHFVTHNYDVIEHPSSLACYGVGKTDTDGVGKTDTDGVGKTDTDGVGKTDTKYNINNMYDNNYKQQQQYNIGDAVVAEKEEDLKKVIKNSEAIQKLAKVGVMVATAKILAEKHGEQRCLANLKHAKQIKTSKIKDFPAFVVYCIENDLVKGQNLFDEIYPAETKEEKEKRELKESLERCENDKKLQKKHLEEMGIKEDNELSPMWKKKSQEYM